MWSGFMSIHLPLRSFSRLMRRAKSKLLIALVWPPLRPGRPTTMAYDYERHGTTTLFAALNVPGASFAS
jgi:hypothetical protein